MCVQNVFGKKGQQNCLVAHNRVSFAFDLLRLQGKWNNLMVWIWEILRLFTAVLPWSESETVLSSGSLRVSIWNTKSNYTSACTLPPLWPFQLLLWYNNLWQHKAEFQQWIISLASKFNCMIVQLTRYPSWSLEFFLPLFLCFYTIHSRPSKSAK